MEFLGFNAFCFKSISDRNSVLSRCAMFSSYDFSDESSGDDAAILLTAFNLFMEYESSHPVPYSDSRVVSLLVTDQEDIVIRPETNVLGTTCSLIVLLMARCRSRKSYMARVAIVLEELFHCYYLISDEWAVKAALMPLLATRFPEASLHRLYPRLFDENGHRITKPDA